MSKTEKTTGVKGKAKAAAKTETKAKKAVAKATKGKSLIRAKVSPPPLWKPQSVWRLTVCVRVSGCQL